MYTNDLLWIANTENGEHINILPKMANRHGLVAGATGTGKTVTLKVLAESFSEAGVPVFIADVKGDVAGMMCPGQDSENMQKRIERFGLAEANFTFKGYPVTIWDLFGKSGIPLRTTVSEVGPLLMTRILELNDLQSDLLTILYKIADDNGLLLIDTKDLKSMLRFVGEHADEFSQEYGKISGASLDVITRSIVALEMNGGDVFFGEPNLDVSDWFATAEDGRGIIQILDSSSLINNGKLYSTFLLWMMAELFETLPEAGDLDKPKMVFFFDEAHLLFSDTSKALLEKVEQVVKLIRSKGVGIYFCTQNPADIPSGVLSQLGNKVQHALRAFTPAEQKNIKAAADSFRANPEFDSKTVLTELGTGEALISFLDEKGTPNIVQKGFILPPQCSMGAASDEERNQAIKESPLYSKYAEAVDNVSAYESLRDAAEAETAAAAEADAAEAETAAADADAAATAAAEEETSAQTAVAAEAEATSDKPATKPDSDKPATKPDSDKPATKPDSDKPAAKPDSDKPAGKPKKPASSSSGSSSGSGKKPAKPKVPKAARDAGRSAAGTVGREIGKEIFGKAFGKKAAKVGGNAGAAFARGLLDTFLKR